MLFTVLPLAVFSGQSLAYEGAPVTDGGGVSGKLVYSGKVPATQKLKVTKNHDVCGQSKDSQELIVGGGGALKNGVVYIRKIKSGKPAKKSKLILDQSSCVYKPHVQAALKGSKIELRNSDSILHNIHAEVKKATAFNIAMPIKGQKINQKLRRSGLVKVKCDAGHTWMSSFIYVFSHPYYAVTGADGTFRIDDIPPGSYQLVAWHEKLGKQKADLTITAKGSATLDFTFR